MPRASRRRRRSPGRGLGQPILVGIAATVTLVLVGGSLLAIHTQSKGYRSATTSGYAALADQVGRASTRTGSQLAALMAGAPDLTNQQLPHTARGILQQGLDAAVLETSAQAAQAATIASPPPVGDFASRFTKVMQLRASTTDRLRTTVDRLLGMHPLPVAGVPAPASASPSAPATLISSAQAAAEMASEGQAFEQADADVQALRSDAASQRVPLYLRRSVWVPPPLARAPLGSAALGATAPALASSVALIPFHHLVVTAVGLSPPPVPSGGVGSAATSCTDPVSTVPGTVPAVLPPTPTVSVLVSVTNCGTVPEPDVTVTVTVTPVDTSGAKPLPVAESVRRSKAVVSIASGASSAPTLAPLPVTSGHRYMLTVSVALPPGQVVDTGATQQFLLQVAG